MIRERFCNQKIYIFLWVEINFVQTTQNNFLHRSDVIYLGCDAIDINTNRVVTT